MFEEREREREREREGEKESFVVAEVELPELLRPFHAPVEMNVLPYDG